MIIDRYARPANLSEPIVSDPILQELDWILDDPYLFALVPSCPRRWMGLRSAMVARGVPVAGRFRVRASPVRAKRDSAGRDGPR